MLSDSTSHFYIYILLKTMKKIINALFLFLFLLLSYFYFFYRPYGLSFSIFLIIAGSFFLVKASDFFVEGAVGLSKKIGVSEHTIGLTIVAFGTSLPEFAVSTIAAIKGHTDTSWGNVIGSNVTNILLILGIAMLIMKLKPSKFAFRDSIYMLLVTIITLFLAIGQLKFYDGIIIFCFYIIFIYYLKRRGGIEKENLEKFSVAFIFMIVIGIAGIAVGAESIIKGVVDLSIILGIRESAIAASIVALGTSLPELATSITATIKNYHGIAIGNVIGSNIVNLGLVLGVSAMLKNIPISMESTAILFFIITSFILPFILKRNYVGRKTGIFFILLYSIFFVFLYIY